MNVNSLKIESDDTGVSGEQRAYARVEACNLISYAVISSEGKPSRHRMGRALDVSQNGIYLETDRRIDSEYISLMTSDVDQKLVEIKGRVAYSQKNGSSMFRTGIQLAESHDENILFAKKLIRVYHKRRTGYHISTDSSDRF